MHLPQSDALKADIDSLCEHGDRFSPYDTRRHKTMESTSSNITIKSLVLFSILESSQIILYSLLVSIHIRADKRRADEIT